MAKVQSKPLEVKTLWRNPDVAESEKGFKLKESQLVCPEQLAGVPLTPSSHAVGNIHEWRKYCEEF